MSADSLDILIRAGQVLDGLGNPPIRADLGIRQGRATIVPPGQSAHGATVLDATGCYVAPGFIDIHGHSDFASLIAGNAASRVAAGVTTECIGNCGYGAFPLAGEVLLRRQSEYDVSQLTIDWHDVAGYFARAQQAGCSINLVTLIGHGNVRGCVVGYGQQKATPVQLAEMCRIVDECMAAGCSGLSSGLEYPPGMWADLDELVALARVVARHGGVYASHIRNESDRLIESVQEFLEILRRSGCRGQLSHVKTAGPANWHKIAELKRLLDSARREGLVFCADRYPYTASSTDLGTMVLPAGARAGTMEEVLARLSDRDSRAEIIAAIRRQKGQYLSQWTENVVVTAVGRAELRACVGKNLRQLSEVLGIDDPIEAAIKLIHDDHTNTDAIHFSMSEQNLREIYTWDFVAVGSDSSCRDYFGDDGPSRPHPRAYGTPGQFADLVVRKWGIMDWPEAVRRMTSLPAGALGLANRGLLREGSPADVVVFDPARLADRATYESPCQSPAGIVATIVNGQIVWQNGAHTQSRPGMMLKHREDGARQA